MGKIFEKICILDDTGLNAQALEELKGISNQLCNYTTPAQNDEEMIARIGDADCILLAYQTIISSKVLAACKNIKYIGLCCSYYGAKSANVPVEDALARGIVIKGVSGYSDIGPIEFVIASLLSALHGFYGPVFRNQPRELVNVPVGVIGAGATGKIAIQYLKALGADVYYYDVKPSQAAQDLGAKYLDLPTLLQTVDCITTHIPRNISIINQPEFELFGNGKIFINTAVGPTFDVAAMQRWLKSDPTNLYLCDDVGMGDVADQLADLPNCIYTPRAAGSSIQCTLRLSSGVVENAKEFLLTGK